MAARTETTSAPATSPSQPSGPADRPHAHASGDKPAHRRSPKPVRRSLVLDANGARNGNSPTTRRRAPPHSQPQGATCSPGLWGDCSLHHLPMVKRAQGLAHSKRASLHPFSSPPEPYRCTQHKLRPPGESHLVVGAPHQDHACIYGSRLAQPEPAHIPPCQLPALGPASGGDHSSTPTACAARSIAIWRLTRKRSG